MVVVSFSFNVRKTKNAEQVFSNSGIDFQIKTVQEELCDDSDTDDAYDAPLCAKRT